MTEILPNSLNCDYRDQPEHRHAALMIQDALLRDAVAGSYNEVQRAPRSYPTARGFGVSSSGMTDHKKDAAVRASDDGMPDRG